MVVIYNHLIRKGFKRIEDVPVSEKVEVEALLAKTKFSGICYSEK